MTLRYTMRILPLVAILAAVPLLQSCGGSSASPRRSTSAVESVTLATVVARPDAWNGDRVEIEGTLLRFTDPDGSAYGVVQDSGQNRLGIKDIDAWQTLVGKKVRATGTIEFDSSFGWFLAQPTLAATTS